jgi:hypothetical protein
MISDNNHITYTASDIQRYYKGQLSPQEMHALEKAALDDPFLADALEGYGSALQEYDGKLVMDQINTLQQQVQTRAAGAQQTAPVRSFRWWKVAAAALVVFTVAYWLLFMNKSEKELNADSIVAQKQEGKAEKAADSAKPVADSLYALDGPSTTYLGPLIVGDSVSYQAKPKLPGENEPGFFEFKTTLPNTKSDTLNTLPGYHPPASNTAVLQGRTQQPLLKNTQPLTVHFDTAKVEAEVIKLDVAFDKTGKRDTLAYNNETRANAVKDREFKLQNIVKGVVTDNKNNPLANVDIKLNNNNRYTTDASGLFKIPVSDTLVNISVSLPGYATQNFQLRSTHEGAGNLADNQVTLQPDARFGESAKNAARKKSKDGVDEKSAAFMKEPELPAAQPNNGWLEYEKYLQTNKRKPTVNADLTGEVYVSFEVNKKGELSQFKIDRPLSPQHDAEAIRLVKEGPSWKLSRGRKARITVIVRF